MCVPLHGTGAFEGKWGHKTCLEKLSWVKRVSLAGVDPRVNNPACCCFLERINLRRKVWLQTVTKKVRVIRGAQAPEGNSG